MNPRIEKLEREIEKTKTKIADLQVKLRDMEKQKTELENTDYVAIARSFQMTPAELSEFLQSRLSGLHTLPVSQKPEESYEE